MVKNIFYAQSGGVTAVVNASACGVIEAARSNRKFGKVLAGQNGIIGALREELIDTSKESRSTISALKYTPAGAFGSCRYRLKSLDESREQYERLIDVFKAHNIGYFFYNGGGDSQDTAYKVSQLSTAMGYPITCIGIPKTVDNDLAFTDCSPGFGSVAKYIAISTREAGLDVASMAGPVADNKHSGTRIFVLEVMGRHSGWIAASAGLSKELKADPPQIILFPEIVFDRSKFLEKVKKVVNRIGYCVVVASEGVQYKDGSFVSDTGQKDAFGNTQLGGVAPRLVEMIKTDHGYKCHWAVADYLQRAARHIASATDVEQAYAVGKAAVEFAAAGKNAVMPIIVRHKTKRYRWSIGEVALARVANIEKKLPRAFISRDGFSITSKARQYLAPLIEGEMPPPYKNGLPQYARLKKVLLKKKLAPFIES